MLCYDRTKCAVNGPRMAMLSQRRGGNVRPSESVEFNRDRGLGLPPAVIAAGVDLGAQGARSMISKIKNFFGNLFGGNIDRAQFDYARQNVWNQFAEIVNAVDALKQRGAVPADVLRAYKESLDTLIEEFSAYYSRVRDTVGASYGDSRFHDFYDVMLAKSNEWARETPLFGNLFSGVGGTRNTGMLMLGALALAFFHRSRR